VPSGCSASVVPSNGGPACCSGLRRSWPGVRRCYAANNVAGIQGSNLTTTRTSPHVVNTRNRPRHFSADVAELQSHPPASTPTSSRSPPRPPPPTTPTCPCAGLSGSAHSSQLPVPLCPYPCALFQGVSRPPGQACASVDKRAGT
jgi:hypothetical protein